MPHWVENQWVQWVSYINCSPVVFILLDFLQTRGVIFYIVSLFECLLLVRFWNEICLSILFFNYIFYLLQPCYRNLMYHIYFAVFCCWGEVVVPSDDLPEIQRINKTAKHWTIIMMRVEPKHNTEQTSATCSSVKNSEHLFCSCFTVAGYFLISFSFMVRSYMCLFSFLNKLPFESKSSYV